MEDLESLEKKRDNLLQSKLAHERKRKLKQEIFALEHPVQAKVGSAVLNMFKPKPASLQTARKTKLKRKVATVSDVNKALSSLMRM